MRSRWTALMFVLVLAGLTPRESNAQRTPPQTPKRKPPAGGLLQNVPNPFNPHTEIVFSVGDATCTPGEMHVVTIRIFNAVAQIYAYPFVKGGNVAGGQLINKLSLGCGLHTARWEGKVLGSSRVAASGVYIYTLEIDGRVLAKKQMRLSK